MKLLNLLEEFIGDVSQNVNIVIAIDKSQHASERQNRSEEFYFDDSYIKSIVKGAIPKITYQMVVDKISINDEILIKYKDLNIVGVLKVYDGALEIKIITVMKKTNFIPKQGTKIINV